jgi:nucleotide-binding universal stress UspA family protein
MTFVNTEIRNLIFKRMQSILVPTDFSENARAATDFAVELANITKAKLILFHVYHVPAPITEAQLIMITAEELERENQERLKMLSEEIISQKNPSLHIENIVRPGFAVDEILQIIKDHAIDLVVMGITGKGSWGETIIGSNATEVIAKSTCPVLAIPSNAKFKPIEKVVFAFDYHEIKNELSLRRLKELIQLLHVEVYILNVVKHGALVSADQSISGTILEDYIQDTEHSFHFSENENVVEGINEFIEEKNADMLVMIPRKHTLFERLFNRSLTKKMAFHISIPLLTIPD